MASGEDCGFWRRDGSLGVAGNVGDKARRRSEGDWPGRTDGRASFNLLSGRGETIEKA